MFLVDISGVFDSPRLKSDRKRGLRRRGEVVISLTCPNCNKLLNIADEYAGKVGACKECGCKISVPIIVALMNKRDDDVTARIQSALEQSEKDSSFRKTPIPMQYGTHGKENAPTKESAWNNLPAEQKNAVIGCIGTLVILGFMLATCSYIMTPSEEYKRQKQEEERWGSPTMAYVMSQEYVKQRLKSPGSAKFPWGSYTATPTSEKGVYLVKGYCDAQNAFGALIRLDYQATMQCHGNGKWSCKHMVLNERK